MTTSTGKFYVRGAFAAAMLMTGAMLPPGRSLANLFAQPAEEESPLLKPAAPVQRVELKPVMKSEPGKVRLTPVLIGEPTPKASPKPTEAAPEAKPEPSPEAAPKKKKPEAKPSQKSEEKSGEKAGEKPGEPVAEKPVVLKWTQDKPTTETPATDKPAAFHPMKTPPESKHPKKVETASPVPTPAAAAEQRPTTATAEVATAGIKQEVPVVDMKRPEFELAQAVTLPGGAAPAGNVSAEAGAKLDEAKRLLNAGNIAEARRMALDIAGADPNAPEVPEARYVAATALQDLAQACNELHQLVLDYPRAPITRQALSRLGEFSFILGKYDETVKAYTAYRLLETDPEALRGANLQLAIAALRGRNYDMAETEYASLLRKYPDLNDSPDVLEGMAEAQLAVGRIADSASTFQTIDSRFPSYESAVKVTMGRGLCAELLGRTAEAIEFYSRIMRDYPQSVEAGLAARRREDLTRPLVAGA